MSESINRSSVPVLGIDWGTSNRRAYLLDERGNLVRQHNDEAGILAVAGDFEKALADLLARLELEQGANVVMSGMVGSRNGWQQVPYLPIDQPISRLPEAMVEIETRLPGVRCRIVPGYRSAGMHGIPDVMRGEETQVFGALALSAASGWFLLPGTHSKWVRIENGKIAEFMTFMTGELFALLSDHGTLANLMQEQPSVPQAFKAGMKAATQGGFTRMAFSCRALVVTDTMPAMHASSYLSGLLIGTELAEIRQKASGQIESPVQIVGSPTLVARYIEALEFFGMSAQVWPPDDVYVAALRALAGLNRNP
jgi:2-dehydro-3-deoxygalactonokinase